MRKRTRAILFLSSTILFLIITPSVILYSQGYRFDFAKRRIIQTGGLFLKIKPKKCQIYLTPIDHKLHNKSLEKESDSFLGSVFIDDLLPRSYRIRVEKEGYFPWEKVLQVNEKRVTEAKHILLISRKLKFTPLIHKIDRVFPYILSNKAVIQVNDKSGWNIDLLDLERMIRSHLIKKEEISKLTEADLLDVEFSFDARRVLLALGREKLPNNFILEIDRTPVRLVPLKLGEGVLKIRFDPQDSNKIFFDKLVDSKVSLFESEYTKPQEKPKLIVENLSNFYISKRYIFWIDKDGFLFRADLSGINKQKLSKEPIKITEGVPSDIIVLNNSIFFKSGRQLYQFSAEKQSFDKVSDDVTGLKLSPDASKVAYFNEHEIWILVDKKKIFLTRLSDTIRNIFWLNPYYLILQLNNGIKIAEIDNRFNINIYTILKTPVKKAFYDSNSKLLYILNFNKELLKSDPIE